LTATTNWSIDAERALSLKRMPEAQFQAKPPFVLLICALFGHGPIMLLAPDRLAATQPITSATVFRFR
jgi:hypothetical protein